MFPNADRIYAETYDDSNVGWDGEMEFYRRAANKARQKGQAVLEIACGTGRVAIALAEMGADVTGLDYSPWMVAEARRKSVHLPNVTWIEGDMRTFDLPQCFGLALIPGHSFQFLCTIEDQMACLDCLHHCLLPGGRLVIHIDHPELEWLSTLPTSGAPFEPGRTRVLTHPQTGRRYRPSYSWNYNRATQNTTLNSFMEELGENGQVVQKLERSPAHLHVVFRFEMEHLLRRAGFAVEALYGGFNSEEFTADSSSMVWMARLD